MRDGSLDTSTMGAAESYVYQTSTPVSVSALSMAVHQYPIDSASAERHRADDGFWPACRGIGRYSDGRQRLCAVGATVGKRAGQTVVVRHLGGIRLSRE